MNIYKAISTDAARLSSLSVDVQRLHAENHPNIFKMPQNKDFAVSFFEEMLADPAVTIFIAEEDESPVGCVLCRLIERPENPFTFATRYLHIDQISVRPEARGQGVGASLMQRAAMLAQELDVRRIQLDSWDFNIKAHIFFERLGFEKFNFRFWREI